MRRATVLCQGVHPLLVHGMGRTQVLRLGKFVKEAEPPPATTDEACRRALYLDEEKFVVLPTDNLSAAIVAAGQRVKIGSPPRQISAAEKTDLFSYFDMEGDYIRILDANRNPIPYPVDGEPVPWTEDVKRGLGRQAKVPTAVCIVRPRFAPWSFTFTCTYDERELPRVKFLELLKQAGRQGLGSARPSKGRMKYGIWRPVRVDEVPLPEVEDGLIVTFDGKPVDLKSEPIQVGAAAKKTRKPKEVAA